MPKSYRTIDAVRKAIEILEFLAHQKEPVAGAEVAQAVNIAVGTVRCHLATLEETRFVRRLGDKYELGMGAALIWARFKSNLEADIERKKKELESISIQGEA